MINLLPLLPLLPLFYLSPRLRFLASTTLLLLPMTRLTLSAREERDSAELVFDLCDFIYLSDIRDLYDYC